MSTCYRLEVSHESLPSLLDELQLIEGMSSPSDRLCLTFYDSLDDSLRCSSRALISLLKRWGWTCHDEVQPDLAAHTLEFIRIDKGPHYRLETYSPSRETECLDLFKRVFERTDYSPLWLWKYRHHAHHSILVFHQERLVGFYGCLSRKLEVLGVPMQGLQMCDVMVDPNEQGRMNRDGAFAQAAKAIQEWQFGVLKQCAFGYGFPTERHLRLGLRQGLYAEADTIEELSWNPTKARFHLLWETRQVEDIQKVQVETALLWSSMSRDFKEGGVIGVRDADYLSWRYFRHPKAPYQVFMVRHRFTQKPRALLVLRKEGSDSRLVDLVAPLEAINDAIGVARRIAGAFGSERLLTWITKAHADVFPKDRRDERSTGTSLAVTVYVEHEPVQKLMGRFWMMMGDTDFM